MKDFMIDDSYKIKLKEMIPVIGLISYVKRTLSGMPPYTGDRDLSIQMEEHKIYSNRTLRRSALLSLYNGSIFAVVATGLEKLIN